MCSAIEEQSKDDHAIILGDLTSVVTDELGTCIIAGGPHTIGEVTALLRLFVDLDLQDNWRSFHP